ncbi:MAG: LysR substrate-binding domain-containing protein [Bacteroidota bacterium]
MELRQIECFIAVAEEGHFGRAAQRVHLSQSAFSRQIQRLEADLGVRLFDRTTRRATLTASGRAFRRDAREVLHWADRARASAQEAADGRAETLRIGAVSSATARLLPALLRTFRERAPKSSVRLVQRFQEEILDALRTREIDVGISRGPFDTADGVGVLALRAEPLVVLLPTDHRLTSLAAVPLEELAREPFVLSPRHRSGGYMATVLALCRSAGFEPRVVEEAEPLAATLALVAAGLGVTLSPEITAQSVQTGIEVRLLAGVPPDVLDATSLSLVWRADDTPPVVARFLRTAEFVIRTGT